MSSINRIDAKQLKYNKTQLTELNAHILELLLDIDNEISDSHDSGKFFINHKLLSVFNVTNMKSAESRRRIHSNIISDLVSRNFLIQYVKSENNYFLKIKWVTDEEITKKENEMKILKFYQYPINNRESFESHPITKRYQGISSLTLKN